MTYHDDIAASDLTDQEQEIALAIRRHLLHTVEFADGWINMTLIHPDKHANPRVIVGWVQAGDYEGLTLKAIRAARLNVQNRYGVHLSLGIRRENLGKHKRGGREDVTEVTGLWADIDSIEGIAALSGYNPAPSIVAHSGGGYHAYWLFNSPAPAGEYLERIMRRIAIDLDGDIAVTTVASNMRVPGTLNTKPDRNCLVEIVHDDYDTKYHYNDLLWLDPGPEPAKIREPRKFVGEIDGAVTAEDIARMCNAKKIGEQWMGYCPAHEDRSPSFRIRQTPDRILVRCFAGCSSEAITESLGLTMKDLYTGNTRPATRTEKRLMLLEEE